MLDFLMISTRRIKGVVEVYPKFIIKTSKDLMIKAGKFYAIWLDELNMWSKNEEDAIRLIDSLLDKYRLENKHLFEGEHICVKYMWDADTGMIDKWHKYCEKQMWECFQSLDRKIIFSDQITKKSDYASVKLKYSLDANGSMDSYNEMISTLYDEKERHKIEWCAGGVLSGDSKKIQKFAAFYGPPGTGKSTIIDILEKLFEGYCAVFKAESLGSSSDSFSLAQLRDNPLVAISHDSDLSKIDSNATLNSLISHEKLVVNEKHKSQYVMKFDSFLFLGTNKPVKITDSKSGLIRRLIDIHPSGNKIPFTKYIKMLDKINFELGAIAHHCINVYLENPQAYQNYRPTLMLSESNDFYNFMSDNYQLFKKDDGTTQKAAWGMYKIYCEEARVPFPLSMRLFSSELQNYFKNYEERVRVGNEWVRSYYSGFKTDIFESQTSYTKDIIEKRQINFNQIDFKEQKSKLDIVCANCLAQYSSLDGIPKNKWDKVTTELKDINTSKLHYLKVPDNHIVIDFDIKDETGNKSFEKNVEEASKWPKTYAELSKSGGGIHLHYIFNGDPATLSRIYADNIEIKVFTGNSSLRRKLTQCNNEDISAISSGLPMKKNGGKMINFEAVKTEKVLRTLVAKNLNKEYHSATKPSMDFINKLLEDAYTNGMKYDVSDMYGAIVAFAANSTNQSEYCLNLLSKMKFKSDNHSTGSNNDEQPIVFYDVEVFPNLLVVNWKFQGKNKSVNRMINPNSNEIESLFKYRLIGFNCRRYDNHIMYARFIGYSIEDIYKLSRKIIDEKQGFFGEAYNISYTDIYDYSVQKQSLKKWQVQLGIFHQELGLPWDEPVPEHLWIKVAEYCDNDVIASEAVFDATQGDFMGRMILSDIAGMLPNDTTNSLSTKIIFGNEKNPQINYVDLSREFPGYEFIKKWNDTTKKFDMFNMYRGIDLGFGGYVEAEPGMYANVGLLDVASMHPNSIIAMNLFGEYTVNFESLVNIRLGIKHDKVDTLMDVFEGKLKKYLIRSELLDSLSYALKIAINSVYGLTSARFNNVFKHPLNENNIVALRGALFMKTLRDELVLRGYTVAHIKTDSIKIPNITQEAIDICNSFAKRYGYEFEHEATYERMCLVNDAVYIAKYDENGLFGKNGKKANEWTATGTQFAVPYVFKKCFSKEQIVFEDLCEVKEVTKSAMYLSNNNEEDLKFIGRVGLFCPVKKEAGGLELVKRVIKKNGIETYDAVTGTKGYLWLESLTIKEILESGRSLNDIIENVVDISYYNNLVDKAISSLSKFGDYERFVLEEKYEDDTPPWL